MGIFQGPQLISTLRHESIDQTELFEHRLEVSFSHLPTRLPISLTCRAATLPEYRGLGLYSVLKMVGLISSLELGHEFSFSLIRKSSFQVEFFKNLGYEFFESNFNKWQSSHPAGSPFCIAKIDLQKKGDRAVHYLAKKK